MRGQHVEKLGFDFGVGIVKSWCRSVEYVGCSVSDAAVVTCM
jgi:hypothetical protein